MRFAVNEWGHDDVVEWIHENSTSYIPCRKCKVMIRIGSAHPSSLILGDNDTMYAGCDVCYGMRRQKSRNRRARKQNAYGSFSVSEWTALCERYNWRCACCDEQKALTADHVIPLILNGTNDITNIQPLCRSCNSSKGVQIIDYRRGRR